MSKKDSLSAHLADYARRVARLVTTTHYSHVPIDLGASDGSSKNPQPNVDLGQGTETVQTDCSGWVHYAMEAVAPLHDAVLQAQKSNPNFNGEAMLADGTSFDLKEHGRAWAQADVMQQFFAGDSGKPGYATGPGTGFQTVASIGDVKPGDVIAYALGIYADPTHERDLPSAAYGKPTDTGHVMIAASGAREKWPTDSGGSNAGAGPGQGLSSAATAVYEVDVVDSSDKLHSDERRKQDGASRPKTRDGLGEGSLWFATDATGKVIQYRFLSSSSNPADCAWKPSTTSGTGLASAAQAFSLSIGRMTGDIDLAAVPKTDGRLVVDVGANVRSELPPSGKSVKDQGYAGAETLTGEGGLLVKGGGTLHLDGHNSFEGGAALAGHGTVKVQGTGTTVSVKADDGLGKDSSSLSLGAGTVLDLRASMGFGHRITLLGDAEVDVHKGAKVRLGGKLTDGASNSSSRLDVTGGGQLVLGGQRGTVGLVQVDGATTLDIASQVRAGEVALQDGAKLRVDEQVTLDALDVSGTAEVLVDGGGSLVVNALRSSSTGSSVLHLAGGGSVTVQGAGEGSGATTFRIDPKHGVDVLEHFEAYGRAHDTLQLPRTDFSTIADVLLNAHDFTGGVEIIDPHTQSVVQVAAVSKADLVANQQVLGLH